VAVILFPLARLAAGLADPVPTDNRRADAMESFDLILHPR
jgi:hypothetical protein